MTDIVLASPAAIEPTASTTAIAPRRPYVEPKRLDVPAGVVRELLHAAGLGTGCAKATLVLQPTYSTNAEALSWSDGCKDEVVVLTRTAGAWEVQALSVLSPWDGSSWTGDIGQNVAIVVYKHRGVRGWVEVVVAPDSAFLAGVELPTEAPAMSEAAASQKLRQILQGYLYEIDKNGRRIVHHMHDEKTNALAELLDSMGKEPLLIGFQYDEDLENIRKVFKNVPYIGQGVSSAVANDNITRWNKRELPAMAVHANSASHGLNLQYGGHHICHLALPWGLDPYKQLNERIDRRGQTHLVYGHHIVARDSKDQDVSAALMTKDEAQNRLIAAIRKL